MTLTVDADKWYDPIAVWKKIRKGNAIHHLLQKLQEKSGGTVGRYLYKVEFNGSTFPHYHIAVECPGKTIRGELSYRLVNLARKRWKYGQIHYRPGDRTAKSIRKYSRYLAKIDMNLPSWWQEHGGSKFPRIIGSRAHKFLSIPAVRPLVDRHRSRRRAR